MNIRVILSLLLPAMFLYTSCMKEDVSICQPGLELQLSYTLNRHETDRFTEEVEAVTALVFDQNDIYLDTYTCKRKELQANNTLLLPLLTGEYSVLVYGGTLKGYVIGQLSPETQKFVPGIIKGQTHKSEVLIKVEGDPTITPQPPKKINALFYGQSKKITVLQQTNPTKVNVAFVKNTNKFRFNIRGLEQFSPSNQRNNQLIDMWCEGRNGRYKFDNSVVENAPTLTYYNTNRFANNDAEVIDFDALRLLVDAPTTFIIQDTRTGRTLRKVNLVDKILQVPGFNTESDMDKCDEYVFDINFNVDTSVTIKVNGWEIIEIEPLD